LDLCMLVFEIPDDVTVPLRRSRKTSFI